MKAFKIGQPVWVEQHKSDEHPHHVPQRVCVVVGLAGWGDEDVSRLLVEDTAEGGLTQAVRRTSIRHLTDEEQAYYDRRG